MPCNKVIQTDQKIKQPKYTTIFIEKIEVNGEIMQI